MTSINKGLSVLFFNNHLAGIHIFDICVSNYYKLMMPRLHLAGLGLGKLGMAVGVTELCHSVSNFMVWSSHLSKSHSFHILISRLI